MDCKVWLEWGVKLSAKIYYVGFLPKRINENFVGKNKFIP